MAGLRTRAAKVVVASGDPTHAYGIKLAEEREAKGGGAPIKKNVYGGQDIRRGSRSSAEDDDSDVKTRAVLLLPGPLNSVLGDGSWTDDIVWDAAAQPVPRRARVLIDHNDPLLTWEAPRLQRPSLKTNQETAKESGPKVESTTVQSKKEQMALEKEKRMNKAYSSISGAESFIRNDMSSKASSSPAAVVSAGGASGGTLRDQRQSATTAGRRSRRQTVKALYHSDAAQKLIYFKPELSTDEKLNFHRPRLIKKQPSKATSKSKATVDDPPGQRTQVELGPVRSSEVQGRRSQGSSKDRLHLNKGDFVMVEYVEEFPHLLSSLGMGSRLVNYWCPSPDSDGVGAGTGGSKNAAGSAAANGGAASGSGVGLRRGLGRGLLKRSNSAAGSALGSVPDGAPRFDEGELVNVEPPGNSEYQMWPNEFGCVEPGHTQSAILTKLANTPVFRHRPRTTDFLMVMTYNPRFVDREYGTVVLREIPSVFVAGQQEPSPDEGVIHPPNSNPQSLIKTKIMRFHISAAFPRKQNALCLSSVTKLFKSEKEQLLRVRLKELSEFQTRGQLVRYWCKKDDADLKHEFLHAELIQMLGPEKICCYESMHACHERLKACGITRLDRPGPVKDAVRLLGYRSAFEAERLKACTEDLRREEARDPHSRKAYEWRNLVEVRTKLLERTRRKQKVASYIYDQLQKTAWHLVGSFQETWISQRGSAQMEIQGKADPSGTRCGFDFRPVRNPRLRKKQQDAQKNVEKLFGTNKDLRKLTQLEMKNVLMKLGMPEAAIDPLARWDRVSAIRDLSAGADKEFGGTQSLSKFVRETKSSQRSKRAQKEETARKIFKAQAEKLSATAHAADADDEDGDEDGDDEEDYLMDFMEELEEEGNDDAAGSAQNVTGMYAANANRSGGREMTIDEKDDENELKKWERDRRKEEREQEIRKRLVAEGIGLQGRHGPLSSASNSALPSGMTSAAPSAPASGMTTPVRPGSPMGGACPPRRLKAVKRISRTVNADGQEEIEVTFLVSEDDVARVQKIVRRNKRERLNRKEKGEIAIDDDGYESPIETARRRGERVQKERERKKAAVAKRKRHVVDIEEMEDNPEIKREGLKLSVPLSHAIAAVTKNNPKTTLNLTSMKQRAKEVKRNQKRAREKAERENLESMSAPKKKRQNRKRKAVPTVVLSECFAFIAKKLFDFDRAYPFHNPVNTKAYPDYLTVVERPMDLTRIMTKAKAGGRDPHAGYPNREEFIADVRLIRDNSRAYNGREDGDREAAWVTAAACALVELAEGLIEKMDTAGGVVEFGGEPEETLGVFEAQVQAQFMATPSRRRGGGGGGGGRGSRSPPRKRGPSPKASPLPSSGGGNGSGGGGV